MDSLICGDIYLLCLLQKYKTHTVALIITEKYFISVQ